MSFNGHSTSSTIGWLKLRCAVFSDIVRFEPPQNRSQTTFESACAYCRYAGIVHIREYTAETSKYLIDVPLHSLRNITKVKSHLFEIRKGLIVVRNLMLDARGAYDCLRFDAISSGVNLFKLLGTVS